MIGAGTFAGTFSLGLRQMLHRVLLTLSAELSGLTMAGVGYLRYRRTNERLKAIQTGFENQEDNGGSENGRRGENGSSLES